MPQGGHFAMQGTVSSGPNLAHAATATVTTLHMLHCSIHVSIVQRAAHVSRSVNILSA